MITEKGINWTFKEWLEKKESTAILEGEDDKGNQFEAIGEEYINIGGEEFVEEICDIENL